MLVEYTFITLIQADVILLQLSLATDATNIPDRYENPLFGMLLFICTIYAFLGTFYQSHFAS